MDKKEAENMSIIPKSIAKVFTAGDDYDREITDYYRQQ